MLNGECVAVMLVIGAAGDNDSFSCSYSPAGSGFALTVAATGDDDMPRPGSNYGDCIDVLAPGDDIMAPYIGESNREEKTLSGSSAATAILTGLAARMMAAVYASDTLSKKFDEVVPTEEDQGPFLKRLLTSTKLANYYDIAGAHVAAYIDCDSTSVTSMNVLLERELHLRQEEGRKVIPGIEKAKNRYLKLQKEKRKNALLKSLES